MAGRKEHAPDCNCVVCKSNRKKAAERPAPGPDVREDPAYRRLAEDYERSLEQVREFQRGIQAAQQQLDAMEVKVQESERMMRRAYGNLENVTRWYAEVVDMLRSTSIVYHRAEGHRGAHDSCDDMLCRGAAAAWFMIGQGPGVDLAKAAPMEWWFKKERNENIIVQFGDPGPLEASDVEEALTASFDEEEDGEEGTDMGETDHIVGINELDEIPDHPAFAGKKVRILDATPRRDPSDPGMPKQARV